MNLLKNTLIGLSLTLVVGCGATGTEETGMNTSAGNPAPQTENQAPAQVGNVTSKIETVGGVTYKVYLQSEANSGNRKGIVLLGGGNEPTNLSPATVDGGLENKTAEELAKVGYVTAVVAYRLQPNVNFADGGVSWDNNAREMAIDMSNVADDIIGKIGGGLSRARVLTGGVSYTAFLLLDNISSAASPLADTRGLLSASAGTNSTNFSIPIFTLNCDFSEGSGGIHGAELIGKIPNGSIKDQSGFFTDPGCKTHGTNDVNGWAAKLVERTQLWLP